MAGLRKLSTKPGFVILSGAQRSRRILKCSPFLVFIRSFVTSFLRMTGLNASAWYFVYNLKGAVKNGSFFAILSV